MTDDRRTLHLIIVFALAKVAFHTVTNGQYGFHRDELATLDDARHLAWGYVAYPPLTPFIGRIELTLFGTSLRGFRFFATAAQSIALVVTALMARSMGGRSRAQWIAALAVALSTISLAASALFQYVSFDFLWWVLIAFFVVKLVDSDDPRWWTAIGATIGLGVLTKYTIAFYVAGLVAGVLFTNLRRHLRSRWLWIGVAISIAIALPNLLWQASHDWISLDFLRSIHARDVRIGRTDHFFVEQLYVAVNPVTVPIWMIGLWAVFASPRLRRFRVIGWMAVVPFVLFVLARGRGYYLGPVYPMLFAAGAVELSSWLDGASTTVRRTVTAVLAVLFLTGAAFLPIVVPIAPLGTPLWTKVSDINHDFREEVGWPELTAEVARIWLSIPPAERARTAIFGGNYGEAGAINLYGPALGLPNAISATNSFWSRGYGDPPPQTLIVLGSSRESLEQHFQSVVLAGHTPNPFHVTNEETEYHPDIFICRGLRHPLPKFWRDIRAFG